MVFYFGVSYYKTLHFCVGYVNGRGCTRTESVNVSPFLLDLLVRPIVMRDSFHLLEHLFVFLGYSLLVQK